VFSLRNKQSSSTTLIGAIQRESYVVIEYRRSTGTHTVNGHVKIRDIALRGKRRVGDTLPDVSINTDYKSFLFARRDLHALHRVHRDTRCWLCAR